MKKILIVGATSAIAEASARLFSKRGDRLYLLARNIERLEAMESDLKIRGAESVFHGQFDAVDFDAHPAMLEKAIESMGGIDIVLIAHGTLPDQKKCEAGFKLTQNEININAMSVISLLTYLANYLEKSGKGTVAVITSVAGDRGRQSNYIYGASKGMVSIFLQGLRNRLFKSDVHVLDIKPGFVDTPMTAEFKKGLLWAKPDAIAVSILHAIGKKRNEVYLPWFWFGIMFVIKNIPESIFKRLGL